MGRQQVNPNSRKLWCPELITKSARAGVRRWGGVKNKLFTGEKSSAQLSKINQNNRKQETNGNNMFFLVQMDHVLLAPPFLDHGIPISWPTPSIAAAFMRLRTAIVGMKSSQSPGHVDQHGSTWINMDQPMGRNSPQIGSLDGSELTKMEPCLWGFLRSLHWSRCWSWCDLVPLRPASSDPNTAPPGWRGQPAFYTSYMWEEVITSV